MAKLSTKQKIMDLLETIKIYINSDGGDVEFVSYKNKILTLRIMGHCVTCPFIGNTFDEGVKFTFINEIPQIQDVKFIF